MAERFLCNVGANPAYSNYINSLRDKLKIKAGEVRQNFMILAKLNSAKWCFRLDAGLIGILNINNPKIGLAIDE